MDQFSSRLGRSGRALFLDCRTLEYDHVPFERAASGLQLIIVNSNVSRRLSGSKYNERQKECEEAVGYFRRHDEAVKALRDVSAEMLQACGDELPPPLLKRARHVVTENRRVRSALEALWSGDWPVFGALMNASHESLRADYEVTSFELDALADGARKIDGVLGARMTGAGFGGCTVNLVRADGAEEFSRVLAERYRKKTGLEPAVYVIGRNLEARILFAS